MLYRNICFVIRFSAFTDLLVGVICMPFIVSKLANREDGEWTNLKWPHNEGSCMIWLFSDLVGCTASIWNLVIIAFDRFLVSCISFAVNCFNIVAYTKTKSLIDISKIQLSPGSTQAY